MQVSAAAGVSPASSGGSFGASFDPTGWHLCLKPLKGVAPPADPHSSLVQKCYQSLPVLLHCMSAVWLRMVGGLVDRGAMWNGMCVH